MKLNITYYLTGGANVTKETEEFRSVEEARKAHVDLFQGTRSGVVFTSSADSQIIRREHITMIDIQVVEAS